MKDELKKQYRDLEMRVLHELRKKVEESDQQSKFVDGKALQVDIGDYTEIILDGNNMSFLNNFGLHYSIHACNLEDLIDLL